MTKEFYFPSSNKISQIRAQKWLPCGEPRGVLQISHGICEHIGRYDHFARFMADHGFAVVANDHLGHGKSFDQPQHQGFFAETGGWARVVDDMHTLYEITARQHPRLPYFLLGHSMGSFLARTYVLKHQNNLRGLLLSGTGQPLSSAVSFGIAYAGRIIKKNGPLHRSKRITLLCFGTYNNAFLPVRTVSDWISRDEQMIDEHLADKLCGFTPTAAMYRDMFTGVRYITSRRNMARMQKDLPVYFFSGDKDPVGEEGKGVERAFQSFMEAGCTDLSLKLYPEGRHEMLNEINKEQVYADLLGWVESKL